MAQIPNSPSSKAQRHFANSKTTVASQAPLFTRIAGETQMHHFDADISNHDESPATHHVRRRQHRRMHLRLACYSGV